MIILLPRYLQETQNEPIHASPRHDQEHLAELSPRPTSSNVEDANLGPGEGSRSSSTVKLASKFSAFSKVKKVLASVSG